MLIFLAAETTSSGIAPAVIAATIAAVVSLMALGVSLISGRRTQKAVEAQRIQDYRIRQLNELYGPLYMLRMTSRRLWRQLPGVLNAEPGVTQWHLIDHIQELKNEPEAHRRLIVEEILKINSQLSDLIVGEAGLLERVPPPESFEKFLEHARTLQVHWSEALMQPGPDTCPFQARSTRTFVRPSTGSARICHADL
jgi:hypothetical protein